MKAIGNIFVAWRKGKGSRRIVIGIIRNNSNEGMRFSYLREGVKEAEKYGFSSYDGFPELYKTYTENVVNIFGQRIMRSERNDVDEFFKFWQIDKKYKEDNFYMLAYTQGLLATDNFEFLADFQPKKGLTFITEISGLSHFNISSDSIKIGDELKYEFEPENERDSNAVKLFKGELFLGYVKIIHNKVFKKTKTPLKVKVHHIEKNGELNRVFLKVSL